MAETQAPLYASALFQRIAGETWRPGGTALTRHALELCSFTPGSDILDIGCGQGASLALVRSLGLNGTGLDKERAITEDFPFVLADAQDPPFPEKSFDGILCECVLSLLPDAGLALRRFARILRTEGRLVLSDLYVRTSSGSAVTGQNGSSCLAGARTRQDLEELLEESGLALLHFEDHTAGLKELAARLLWYGDESLCSLLRGQTGTKDDASILGSCTCGSLRPGGTRYGYGLWIASPAPAGGTAPNKKLPEFPRDCSRFDADTVHPPL